MAQDHHYQVTYYHKDGKADDSSKRFADEKKAKDHAFRGNAINKVGGTYKVHKVMSPIDEANDAPFDGPYTNTFKKKSNPNRTGMDAARSLAQRGIAKAKVMAGNEKFSSSPDKLKKQHFGMSEDFTEEEVDEMINEVLSKDAKAGDWIHDFVHSDNPKFKGKSAEQRKQMALAAYYAKQRNEEIELDEKITVVRDPNKVRSDAPQGRGDVHIPVAPVPHKKYIIGTPEWKAHKASRKPINGHPTNKTNEEVEQIDEISDKTLANYVTAARKDREHNKVNKSAPDTTQRASANERDKKRIAGMNKANSYLTPGTAGHSKNQARRAANEEVDLEEGDLTVRTLYNKFANAHVNGHDTKSTEKVIRKVHGDEVMGHMKKAAKANAKADMDGEERHFDNAQTAAKKTDRIGGTVGRGRSEFMRKRREWSEEVEQIDELSPMTLGSYIKKSKGSIINHGTVAATSTTQARKDKSADTIQKRAKGINKAVDRLTKEEVELDEHLVHVNDGSKYGEQPHDKDAEHVMAGVKKHNGEFDGHSDKGAFFKFKTADDAKNFKRHVDSCPHKTCDADLHESTQNVKPTVKTDKYSWGTMKTIHHGSSFSIPLHPEHHEHIAKMKDQQVHNIKTEDGRQWHVKREGDTVHFHGANGGNKTSVPHKSLAEETNKEGTMKSYKEFLEGLNEVKLADLPVRRIQGRSYGNQPEEPDHDEDDEVKPKEKAEKRGRGRPAGSKSGARQLGGASKKGSGVEYTGFKLHLPNSNR